MLAALLSSVLLMSAACAERATERYAPAQLGVAQDMLQRARAAAALGDAARAARLAWAMTESDALRAQAAEIGGKASALVTSLVEGQ